MEITSQWLWLCVKRILASVVRLFDPWIKHFQIKVVAVEFSILLQTEVRRK